MRTDVFWFWLYICSVRSSPNHKGIISQAPMPSKCDGFLKLLTLIIFGKKLSWFCYKRCYHVVYKTFISANEGKKTHMYSTKHYWTMCLSCTSLQVVEKVLSIMLHGTMWKSNFHCFKCCFIYSPCCSLHGLFRCNIVVWCFGSIKFIRWSIRITGKHSSALLHFWVCWVPVIAYLFAKAQEDIVNGNNNTQTQCLLSRHIKVLISIVFLNLYL